MGFCAVELMTAPAVNLEKKLASQSYPRLSHYPVLDGHLARLETMCQRTVLLQVTEYAILVGVENLQMLPT